MKKRLLIIGTIIIIVIIIIILGQTYNIKNQLSTIEITFYFLLNFLYNNILELIIIINLIILNKKILKKDN